MKKIKYFLGAALMATVGLTSCTLDAVNYTEMTSENYPATTDDLNQALIGVYQNLNKVCANPQMSFLYVSMLASDDNLGGGGTNDKLMQAVDLLCNYQQNMTRQFWIDRYEGIDRANRVINAIPNIEGDEATLNNIEGDACFLLL